MNGLLVNVQVTWIDKNSQILERHVEFMGNDISSDLFIDKYKMNKN